MNTALCIKVVSVLGYVLLSTALVAVLLADECGAPGQSVFALATLP